MSIQIYSNIRYLKGVGAFRGEKLEKLGIFTLADLLTYFPQRYEDRRNIKSIAMINNDETAVVKGTVLECRMTRLKGNKKLVRIKVIDSTGILTLLGFNQPYLKNVLKAETIVFVYGKFIRTGGGLQTSAFTYEVFKPDKESFIHVGRIVPIYSLTGGITEKWFRSMIYHAVEDFNDDFDEYIPENIIKNESLLEINRAIRDIHFPQKTGDVHKARSRLVFGEFLLFQTALALKKSTVFKAVKKRAYSVNKNLLTPFKEKLGFEFTNAQKKAIRDIFNDVLSIHPMNRLLQGEVGSGKTVVAISAVLLAVENSYMGVIIAPTEILAEQHYLTFKSYLESLGVKIDLLTGNTARNKRDRIMRDLTSSNIDILVGTHALLQDDVDISRAGVIIIDEQHRFGVQQKAVLVNKSELIDTLAMSATPIPRTLAMCSYGDLDISTIKELPKNRKKPVTRYVREEEAYSFAKKEIIKGNLVYIVHPVIEESRSSDWNSAAERYKKIGGTVFSEFKCALLHGRMTGSQKEQIMRQFSKGEYQVLFTTTVIEVGINVPQACVMIIENFNRYGLSTLHQLRGRIARSHRQPYCLLTGNVTTPESKRRLKVLLSTNDGFKIAEEDLRLRGAGELFGTRQHGLMNFRIADPVDDFELLKLARKYAFTLVESDSRLANNANRQLKEAVYKEYGNRLHLADVS